MSVHELPLELLDSVCQYLSLKDLATLSRTTTYIRPVAERWLYRHLLISSFSKNLHVVGILATKIRIARHVRTFALRIQCSTVFNSFYHLLAIALSNMTELVSLELFVDSGVSWILHSAQSSIFPRLSHFACSFPFDSHVVSFLAKTEALLELEVDETETIQPIPVQALPVTLIPRLSRFVGSSHAANAVVPGRPIQSIHVLSGDVTEGNIVNFAKSSANVIILDVTTSSLPAPLLNTLTLCMPHLVYLRIMTTYNFANAPDVAFYEQTSRALGSLSDLQAFELSGIHTLGRFTKSR